MLDGLAVACRPIDPGALLVLIRQTMALWRVPSEIETTAAFYLEALAEFPLSVVEAALKHVRLTHRYPTMPTPADFRLAAEAAAVPMRGALARARLARSRLDAEARRIAEAAERVATRKPLDIPEHPVARKRMERARDDGSPLIDLGDTAARMREWQEKAGA